MDLLQIVILSIVEGITEFLPISSTAHLILTSHLLGIRPTEFLTTFEIAIQLGAIAAVVVLFYHKILTDKPLFFKACIAFLPTGILGVFLYKYIKTLLSDPFIPVIALFLGGIAIIGIEKYFQSRSKNYELRIKNEKTSNEINNSKFMIRNSTSLSYKHALLIGLFQSISMIPGVSRSAASIFGGMAVKLDRQSAVEFSFLLAIPTMTAATGLDLVQSAGSFTGEQILQLIVGMVGSFITALIVIKWLIKYVQTNNFIVFGIYRIIASIIYYIIFLRS